MLKDEDNPLRAGLGLWSKILTGLLVLVILGAVGGVVYLMAAPKVGEKFTEFYLLGPEGKAENYPQKLMLGEEFTVRLGIVNREFEVVDYRVEITIDGEKVEEVGPVTLEHEEQWEQELAFAPVRAGPDQKVEFLLYKGAGTELYQTLYLFIDVREGI